MRCRIVRLLVLACSLPLVLPPGWCCFVVQADCCVQPQKPTQQPLPTSATKACCHSSENTGDDTAKSNQKPAPSPVPDPCHCDMQPTVLFADDGFLGELQSVALPPVALETAQICLPSRRSLLVKLPALLPRSTFSTAFGCVNCRAPSLHILEPDFSLFGDYYA